MPNYEALVHSSKVHLLQSIVARLLVEMVFESYFFGLSKAQTAQFRDMEAMLRSFCESARVPDRPSTTSQCAAWPSPSPGTLAPSIPPSPPGVACRRRAASRGGQANGMELSPHLGIPTVGANPP